MSSRARFFGVLALSLLFLNPQVLFAASISFSPASGSHGVGEEFSVRVQIVPSSESVNAADGTLAFDPAVLSVSSISRDGAAFSLWTSDPVFSNSAGTITFSGGTPTAFSAAGTALTIKFRGKAQGTGAVSVTKASILAADGKGTDVYKSGAGASYTITASSPKPAAPEPEPEPSGEAEAVSGSSGDALVPPPDITSSTHKKADQWYATSTAIFSWKIPVGMLSVRTLISKDQNEKPKKAHTPIISTETVRDLTEGIWYFSAQYKDDFEWGDVSQREVRVDLTPPEEFEIALVTASGDAPPKLSFGATDALSGMGRYEIYLNDTIAGTVTAADLVDNSYPVPPQEGGSQKVTIKAVDAAGNVREVSKQIDLPLVKKVDPKAAAEAVPVDGGFRYEWVVIAVFAAAIGGLVAWQVQMKKASQSEQSQILQRVIEIREKNDRVFAAMREEFEQLINDFDERPQLTPAERDLLEKMKEVLDISEEVVDTDIEQLKRLLKKQ